ncbi:MAG: class I SAM-dependent methyltransferase [Verrucomicrobiota bacterium]
MRATDSPQLDDYQSRFVENVRRVVQNNYLWLPPRIKILDAGCDPTGRQLWHLARLTKGELIGINVAEGFPSPQALKLLADIPNATLKRMDAMQLEFPDESFDMVISANVIEHVADPRRYIQQCCRVLRKNGVAYFESYPIWTAARGHHIMESMVHDYCGATENYCNDGSIIPDWSHLCYGENQMRSCLEKKLKLNTVNWVLQLLYRSAEFNKIGWWEIRSAFEAAFPTRDLRTYGEPGASPELRPHGSAEDYEVAGFELVARKAAQPRLRRTLLRGMVAYRRRLRLLGYAISRRLQRSPQDGTQ